MKENEDSRTEAGADGVFDQFVFKPALEMFNVFREQAESAPESYGNLMNIGTKFWASVMSGLADQPKGRADDAQDGASAGVDQLFGTWQKLYEETMGKYLTVPAVGPAREYAERMQSSLHCFMRYQGANMELQRALCVPLAEAMKQIALDMKNAEPAELEKKDFKHLQQEWMKTAEDRFLHTLRSPEFSKVLAHSMNTSMDFWNSSQKTLEDYLKFFPVATSTELDEVHRELYELKKHVRALYGEVRELRRARDAAFSPGGSAEPTAQAAPPKKSGRVKRGGAS